MKRHHLPPYHWSIIWKQSMQLWLPFISPLASCRFEIGHTVTGLQSEMLTSKGLCFCVLTFSEFFMNNFRKAVGLPIKFYLTSEFWILFFFFTLLEEMSLREDITLSLYQHQQTDPDFHLPGEILSLSSRVPFWFLSSPLGVPTHFRDSGFFEWSYIIVLLPTDIITKFISLYWVLVVHVGFLVAA